MPARSSASGWNAKASEPTGCAVAACLSPLFLCLLAQSAVLPVPSTRSGDRPLFCSHLTLCVGRRSSASTQREPVHATSKSFHHNPFSRCRPHVQRRIGVEHRCPDGHAARAFHRRVLDADQLVDGKPRHHPVRPYVWPDGGGGAVGPARRDTPDRHERPFRSADRLLQGRNVCACCNPPGAPSSIAPI